EPRAGESPKGTACRIVSALHDSVFAIQGPPGAGKTFTGARMICELVKQGKKIGVTALSHKVIRKLLEEVVDAAEEVDQLGVNPMQRSDDQDRKSTRLNSSHGSISYAVFCLKKKNK